MKNSIVPRFAAMVALVTFGFVLSIAHHLSYRFLSGKSTTDYPQSTVKAIALTVAFLIKSSFAATIGIAFEETAWNAVRSGPTFPTLTLDKIFAVQSNPLKLFSINAFQTASGALILSALRWGMPLAAILPPGTLNVRIAAQESVNNTCYVPTFNSSLGRTWFPGGLGKKVLSTPELDKWSFQTVIPGHTAFVSSDTFCGANCSYTQSFIAPQLNCEYTDIDVSESFDIAEPKNGTDWYRCPLYDNDEACYLYGSPIIHDSAPDARTRNRSSFSITYANSYNFIDSDWYQLRMNYTRLFCGYSPAYYNLSVEYINSIPRYNVTTAPFSLPSDYHPDYYHEPNEDEKELWEHAVTARGLFHYFQLVWISGKIQLCRNNDEATNHSLELKIDSRATYTPLINSTTLAKDFTIDPVHDFTKWIPELFQNFTISTFTLEPSHTNITACTMATMDSIYQYEARALLISYGVAAVISMGCALWGLRSLLASGEPAKPMFTQFVDLYR